MIFIAVKFPIKPELSDQWLALAADFTRATRAEEGNLFFEWSRSADDPNEFVLLEAFRDAAAGEAHVQTEHFKTAIATFPDSVSATPKIVNFEIPGESWSAMSEIQPRQA